LIRLLAFGVKTQLTWHAPRADRSAHLKYKYALQTHTLSTGKTALHSSRDGDAHDTPTLLAAGV